ncbi:MAG: helix-turn-helix domain-containing protein [Kiritimatiellae bacterium]|nr:helix-turn-helix domain-containing protein [Kiritimatiellia bacterium]
MKTKNRKLGVRALARELGRSPSHICRVLHGERRPSPALRRSLSKRGISVEVA